MKYYKIQIRSQKNSQSCVPLKRKSFVVLRLRYYFIMATIVRTFSRYNSLISIDCVFNIKTCTVFFCGRGGGAWGCNTVIHIMG